jgi:hypothetical protein
MSRPIGRGRLRCVPAAVVFEPVVVAAEDGEVVVGGWPAGSMVDGVVDVGGSGGNAAAGARQVRSRVLIHRASAALGSRRVESASSGGRATGRAAGMGIVRAWVSAPSGPVIVCRQRISGRPALSAAGAPFA